MGRRTAAEPGKAAAQAPKKAAGARKPAPRRAPRPRTPPPPDPLRAVTADEVWAACPPMGQPADTTRDITDRLGLTHATPVLTKLHALAEQGRVQRLHRTGSDRYWWRRQ